MFASLSKNALPLALVLLCAAAMYLVYRDMRRMEVRMARMDALVSSIAENDNVFDCLDAVCPVRFEPVPAASVPAAAPAATIVVEETPAAVEDPTIDEVPSIVEEFEVQAAEPPAEQQDAA